MIAASFTAWQTNPGKKNFQEYIKALGLAEKGDTIKMSKTERTEQVQKGLSIAEKIMLADKGGK